MARARDTATLDMFEIPIAPVLTGGSLEYAIELCCALSDAITKSGLSRYQIAARMSELTGQEITKAQLDAWTAESKTPWRFPFEYSAAFEVACSTTCLQDLLGRKRGSRILVGEEALYAELGLVKKQREELAMRERALMKRMGATKRAR